MRWMVLFLFYLPLCAQSTVKHTAYFDVNSFTLTVQETKSLSAFIKSTDTLTITSIAILAYCDDRGAEDYNRILSTKRAAAVAAFFNNELLTKAHGEGEIALTALTDTVSQRRQNRRADISITYTVPTKITSAAVSQPLVHPKQPEVTFTGAYKKLNDTLQPGDKLFLHNLLFKGSRSVLKKRSEKDLKKLLEFLKANPNLYFEIQGHVCCIESFQDDAIDSDTNTVDLSVRRAKRVYDYLLDNGIAPKRMTYKGYGRQYPIEGGKEKDNKRVEILITKT